MCASHPRTLVPPGNHRRDALLCPRKRAAVRPPRKEVGGARSWRARKPLHGRGTEGTPRSHRPSTPRHVWPRGCGDTFRRGNRPRYRPRHRQAGQRQTSEALRSPGVTRSAEGPSHPQGPPCHFGRIKAGAGGGASRGSGGKTNTQRGLSDTRSPSGKKAFRKARAKPRREPDPREARRPGCLLPRTLRDRSKQKPKDNTWVGMGTSSPVTQRAEPES